MKKILFFFVVVFSPFFVWADDFVPETEDIIETSADNFILNADDTAGDIDLQFGTTLAEVLRWDDSNSQFLLSDDLSLGGNELKEFRAENLSSAPTCDGTQVGRMYYNTTDSLTYICNGADFNPLENVLGSTIQFPAVQARRTTIFNLTEVFSDIDLDTTDIENASATLDHDDVDRDRINIGQTGLYQIIYGFTAGGTATGTHEARARVRVNDTSILPGSEAVNRNYQVEFSTTSASFLAALNDGDFISLQLNRNATVDATQDEIYFSIVKLEGIKGEVGADGTPGLPGSVGLGTDELSFTIDQDNVTAGADIDIVAEQGSDNNGVLRYDSTDNVWKLSNDGGAFQTIATEPIISQVYESGTTVFNGLTSIDWDGTSASVRIVDAEYTHSTVTNPSQVTLTETGLYEVSYNVVWDTTANARRTASCQLAVNGGIVSPTVGRSHDYARNNTDDWGSNSANFFYNFSSSDYYEIQCQSTGTAGNITTLANESWTTIKKIR